MKMCRIHRSVSVGLVLLVMGPTPAYAYNSHTHSRLVELGVRAMRTDPADLTPPPGQEQAFQEYVAAMAAAPERLLDLKVGLPEAIADEEGALDPPTGEDPYPIGAVRECDTMSSCPYVENTSCKWYPDDDLSKLEDFRIRDFRYIPQRSAKPCGLKRNAENSPVNDVDEKELQGQTRERRTLETVLGFHARTIDDHLNDSVVWYRPTSAGYVGLVKEGLSLIYEYGLGTILLPFACAYEAIFGDGCDLDDSYEFARENNAVDYIEGWIPGVGSTRSDTYTGLWHYIHVDSNTNRFNDKRGMWYLGAGASHPGAIDVGVLAWSDITGLSLNAGRSVGDDHYGQYDSISRGLPAWQAHTIGHLEWSSVDNLARYGWDKLVASGYRSAEGLGWPLHAIGDVSAPHHVVGTTSWGHRPYEEIAEHRESEFIPLDFESPDAQAQLQSIAMKGFSWWQQFRQGEDIQALIEQLAQQTRSKVAAKGDWAYQDWASVHWQTYDATDADAESAESEYDIDGHEGDIRDLMEDAAAASLAILVVAAAKVPAAPKGDISCPPGTAFTLDPAHYENPAPHGKCTPAPVITPPPLDIADAGIAVVGADAAPSDACDGGVSCTQDSHCPSTAPYCQPSACCGTTVPPPK